MFLLILVGYLIYKNAQLAKMKDKNMFLWGTLTFIAIFCAEIIGMMVLVFGYYPELMTAKDVAKSQEMARSISDSISNNVLQSFLVMFCGFGGYLLIRYILERSSENAVTDDE